MRPRRNESTAERLKSTQEQLARMAERAAVEMERAERLRVVRLLDEAKASAASRPAASPRARLVDRAGGVFGAAAAAVIGVFDAIWSWSVYGEHHEAELDPSEDDGWRASGDHPRASGDHPRASGDHPRASGDDAS